MTDATQFAEPIVNQYRNGDRTGAYEMLMRLPKADIALVVALIMDTIDPQLSGIYVEEQDKFITFLTQKG